MMGSQVYEACIGRLEDEHPRFPLRCHPRSRTGADGSPVQDDGLFGVFVSHVVVYSEGILQEILFSVEATLALAEAPIVGITRSKPRRVNSGAISPRCGGCPHCREVEDHTPGVRES
jgi:hypothetical protein